MPNLTMQAQTELETECVCSKKYSSQFPEDEMYSTQLQMALLEEPASYAHRPTSSIKPLLNFISKLSFVHELVLRNLTWQW